VRLCCGDDGEALWKIKFDDEFLADDVEVSEAELKPLQLLYTKESKHNTVESSSVR